MHQQPQDQNSSFKIPSYATFGNLRVLVSPFMPFNTTTRLTDIIMCNSRNLGALIVKDDPHVKSWDEPQYSIHNIGIEESYGFGVLNEGQAINVHTECFLSRALRRDGELMPRRPVLGACIAAAVLELPALRPWSSLGPF